MRDGLQKLEAAIAQASAEQTPTHWKVALRWRGGWRGITAVAATAAVVAAAAVTGAIVLPSSSTPSPPGSQAAANAEPTANPGAEVTLSSVSYTIDTSTTSSTTAAAVLDAAAAAMGKQSGPVSGPNIDWSEPYFHTVEVTTCNGGAITYNVWQTRTGNGAGAEASRGCSGQGSDRMYPIVTTATNFYRLGNQALTESQVDQLPTDPAKLWPLLEGLDGDSLGSDPANPDSNASLMFQSIWNMVTNEPLSPAFRKALLEDAAKIPGVTVEGKYTDSLGRTGTVLHVGIWTIAVDKVSGQILSQTNTAIPGIPICSEARPHNPCQPGGSSVTVYVSAQLVPGVPKAVADTIAYATAQDATVRMTPTPASQL
ncbi:MAG: hypothetical protein ACRDP7_27030 [Trebonia sp.]